jgi:hypothetical protein
MSTVGRARPIQSGTPGIPREEVPYTVPRGTVAKGRSNFTAGEARQIRDLLGQVRTVESPQQKGLRGQLRDLGFYITDWDQTAAGFTAEDFNGLVEGGLITIEGSSEGASQPDVRPDEVGWLMELLGEMAESVEVRERQSSDPFGAEVLFDDWDTIQRLALGKSGSQLAMCVWPGELKGQAGALYGGERVARLLAFLGVHGEWQATPKPHLAFPFAKFPEVLYLSPTLDATQYLERWAEPDAFAEIRGHRPDSVQSELWPWLLEQGFTDETPAQDGSLDAYLERVANRPQALMRPGIELRREWDWDEARAVGRESLVGELRESMREILEALDEPGLNGSAS